MKETNLEVIELRDKSISSEKLRQVIDNIYSGYLCINRKNAYKVLAVADHFYVKSVVIS